MKICLLIINYNGFKYLPNYLQEISNCCQYNGIRFIITDDQSKDESIEFLAQSNYEYTVNRGNKHGFAANINHGIRYALNLEEFDYFIISNNDIEISKYLLESIKKVILALISKNKQLGIIGFDEINKNRYAYFKEFDYKKFDTDSIKEVDHIPGFFFIISKELINEIGYFDEEYFMYGEDNDYFTRTKKAKFKIFNSFLPVMHYSEGSSTNDRLTSWYIYRNAFLFAQKNLNFLQICKLLLSFLYIIYNPFYHINNPNSSRLRRNGFWYNNYLLIKSLVWNLNYFVTGKFNKKRDCKCIS